MHTASKRNSEELRRPDNRFASKEPVGVSVWLGPKDR